MQTIKFIAALSGALAVGIGAFGAHGLKPYLDAYQTDIYNKAVLYHFIHTIVVYVVCSRPAASVWARRASVAMLVGIVFFSGSLYLLATAHLTHVSKALLGPITPLGGLCFIVGWLMLSAEAVSEK